MTPVDTLHAWPTKAVLILNGHVATEAEADSFVREMNARLVDSRMALDSSLGVVFAEKTPGPDPLPVVVCFALCGAALVLLAWAAWRSWRNRP